MKIKGIVCIQNNGPSGSLFLHALLDGHPELLTLPALYSRELYQFWFENSFNSSIELVEKFISIYAKHWFDYNPDMYRTISDQGLDILGDNMDEHIVADSSVFKELMLEYLREYKIITRRVFIESVYIAWNKLFNNKRHDEVYILFAFHQNPIWYLRYIIHDFPEVIFIYCVRNLIRSLNSGEEFARNTPWGRDPLFTPWFILPNTGTCKMIEADNIRYAAVRLEDIHSNPEETMQSICNFINIKFDNVVLEPSFEGKRWWNRKFSINNVRGLDKNFVQKNYKLKLVTKFDGYRINHITTKVCQVWGYDNPLINKKRLPNFIYKLLLIPPFKLEFAHIKVFKVWRKRFRCFDNIFTRPILFVLYYVTLIMHFIRNYFPIRKYYFMALESQDNPNVGIVSLLKNER